CNRDQVLICYQRCGLIRARPPDVSIGHQAAENLAAFHPGTGVAHSKGLAARKFALRLLRRARTIVLNRLRAQTATRHYSQQNRKKYLVEHEHPPLWKTMLVKKPAISIASSSNIQRPATIVLVFVATIIVLVNQITRKGILCHSAPSSRSFNPSQQSRVPA